MKFAFEENEYSDSADNDLLLNQVLEVFGCYYLTRINSNSPAAARLPRFITDCGCCLSLKGLDYYLEVYKRELLMGCDQYSAPVTCFMCFKRTLLRYTPIPTSHLGEAVAYIQEERNKKYIEELETELIQIESNMAAAIADSRSRLRAVSGHFAQLQTRKDTGPYPADSPAVSCSSIGSNTRKSSVSSNRSGLYQFTDMLDDEPKEISESTSQEGLDLVDQPPKSEKENPLNYKIGLESNQFLKKRTAFQFDDAEVHSPRSEDPIPKNSIPEPNPTSLQTSDIFNNHPFTNINPFTIDSNHQPIDAIDDGRLCYDDDCRVIDDDVKIDANGEVEGVEGNGEVDGAEEKVEGNGEVDVAEEKVEDSRDVEDSFGRVSSIENTLGHPEGISPVQHNSEDTPFNYIGHPIEDQSPHKPDGI